MKEVMSSFPILSLPDFTQPYVLECDASRDGIGAVLMQNGHPIAYERKKLKPHERHYSIYEKEMLSNIHALEKLRQYLVGGKFIVKTDHNSLRHFLTQRELNDRKPKWVIQIQSYDFDIEYEKGKINVVADEIGRAHV